MSNIFKETFANYNVRYYENEGNNYACAMDLIEALGYSEPRKTWYDFYEANKELLGTVAKFPTVASNGKKYLTTFIDLKQTVALFIKSNKPASIEFQKWALSVLEKEITKLPEDKILDLIMDLTSYSTIKLRKEVSVVNYLPDSRATTRRYDIVQFLPKRIKKGEGIGVVRIYELKAREITVEDVCKTIGIKGYIHLAKYNYPGKEIELVFLSPVGISEGAARLLEQMPGTKFQTVQSFCDNIYKNIKKNTPIEAHWYLNSDVFPKFNNILPPPPIQLKVS